MLSRTAKATYYALAGPAMALNGRLYRGLRAPRSPGLRVHLGTGQVNYIDGWINVDANRFTGRCDVWADLRNPLPFHDGTVGALYSHHVVEHLPDIARHFADAFRCLAPGAVYRVAGPHGDMAIRKFDQGDAGWFGDFPDRRRSIGGRFENFVFCRQEHLTILTRSFVMELLEDAGFTQLESCMPVRETRHPALFSDVLRFENEDDFEYPHTLVIEAVKPGRNTGA